MVKKATKKFAIGTIVAAAAGYITGILTAPKSGKETRQDIHDGAIKAKREAEKKLKSAHSELDKLIRAGKKKATELKSTSKVELNKALDAATVAKNKARDVLSAVHEGGSEDKDLEKAVKDADNAIKSLKKYLNK